MTGVARVLALSLVALVCLSGCSTRTEDAPPGPSPGNRTAELRDTAVRAAERAAVAVVSLDRRDAEAKYDRLLGLLGGAARQEWERQRAERIAEITSAGITAEPAAVTASGVAALDPGIPAATVLVAATTEVTTGQAPAQERRYRLRLALTRAGEEWKVSELRFVS